MKPDDLLGEQEAGHLPAGVRSDARDRIGPDMTGGLRAAHDLAQHGKRHVGRARRLAAHGVEPAFDMGSVDAVETRPRGDLLPRLQP